MPPKWRGNQKNYTIDFFDHLTELKSEENELDLMRKKREVSEKAKKRF